MHLSIKNESGNILINFLIIIAIILVAVLLVYIGLRLSKPKAIPPSSERIYIREIKVLVDLSKSMKKTGQDLAAKKVVIDGLLPKIGLGDQLIIYRISSNFTQNYDQIIFPTDMPKVPKNILQARKLIISEDFSNDLINSFNIINDYKKEWKIAIDTTKTDTGNFSDYASAIWSIGKGYQHIPTYYSVIERHIIIIGDLKNEIDENGLKNAPSPLPEPDSTETNLFDKAIVWLVYPTSIHQLQTMGEYVALWKDYFNKRGCTNIKDLPFNEFIMQFPPSQTLDLPWDKIRNQFANNKK